MTRRGWSRDSITVRFALAIAASATVCLGLNVLADAFIGGPAFSPGVQAGVLEQLVRRLDAAPPQQRDTIARSAATGRFGVSWDPAGLPPASASAALQVAPDNRPITLTAALRDGSRVIFTSGVPEWTVSQPTQWVLRIAILAFSILVVSWFGASRLARPIHAFATAARRFGADPNAQPMPPLGPREIRHAITAFNTMQSQIQRFVAGQAAMFAAISHDLRTPLTRMRLRGEFIDDPAQQARLFRDVDEMQAMVTAMLMFLRDNAAEEQTTSLDLAELLRSIADDCADIGGDVAYNGPPHVRFPGRPVGLRRAFGNLVDNAIKYGRDATIELQCRANDVSVTVTDRGPGIPAEALESVFAPFHRLEPSRNRHTGGMGLGLTASRAAFRAHGGDVVLSNKNDGGLMATVTLPIPTSPPGGAARGGGP